MATKLKKLDLTDAKNCNLVLCFDGTWNTEDPDVQKNNSVTNVFRMSEAIQQDVLDESGSITHVNYFEGPGTKAGNKLAGGLLAADFDEVIKDGYRQLVMHVRACRAKEIEPKIYLFGFSRGAYICHVFSWLLPVIGITTARPSEWDGIVDDFLARDPEKVKKAIGNGAKQSPRVTLMGLWDAVSSQHDFYRGFFNGLKAPIVDKIRHVMAADERRELFPVMHYLPNDAIRQVWFPGVHSEVGGGYANDKSLYRLSLDWMIKEAELSGLKFLGKSVKSKINWLTLPKHCPPTSRDYAVRCYWPQDELDDSLLERTTATFQPVEFDNFESDNINIKL